VRPPANEISRSRDGPPKMMPILSNGWYFLYSYRRLQSPCIVYLSVNLFSFLTIFAKEKLKHLSFEEILNISFQDFPPLSPLQRGRFLALRETYSRLSPPLEGAGEENARHKFLILFPDARIVKEPFF